ncbi:uncharacterized protein LOC117807098 isoform X2 [Notolabrus celidotus]|uniref:uncharacterized protein LOC117807098 isoform X2 n=1 Tax=Notolabrus celidotus TaxID=1203425 RepID=UPI00148FA722|nr:uncharacterized protein LOC117807098 isoform X2 [Notolabrus celidotus]
MTSPKLLFYLLFFILEQSAQVTDLSSSVHQERSFVSVNEGDSLTLQCVSKGNMVTRFFWYKQPLGHKPRLMSTFITSTRSFAFYDEWKNNSRFTLDTENGGNNLVISDSRVSDTATYFCACSFSITFEFLEGFLVSVKSSDLTVPTFIHQSESETIQPGGSVTLSCTVHTGSCDGEHSVYWFKDSEESQPGLIYTSGGQNDQCEREHNHQTCVYNLPVKSVNRSHAGTYYCAVVSCGHVTFGNRTELELDREEDSLVSVYFLSGALTFTIILIIFLAFILMVNMKLTSCQCRDTLASSSLNAQANNNEDDLHYAAVRVSKARRSRRHGDDTEAECVYTSVKQ